MNIVVLPFDGSIVAVGFQLVPLDFIQRPLVAFDIENFAQAFGHLSYKIGLAGSVRAEPVTLRSSLADLHGVYPQEQIIVVFFYRVENRQRMVVLLPFGVEAVCIDGQQRMTEPLGDLHRTIAPIQRGEK